MSESNKSYRIKTNVSEDQHLNVKLDNDIDIIEILSLKVNTESLYKIHTSKYGCVTGRVLANGNVGVPNAKISIFVNGSEETDKYLSQMYPYTTPYDKDENDVRYNLLTDKQISDCHTVVGTFYNKREVLDNDVVLETYDKYYKFTTRTNDAGDYIFIGIPTGAQTLHIDVDLSDIGYLSQKPRDMIYKGYNITQFENANKFKYSENLNDLTQVITRDVALTVYPFWGDEGQGDDIKITRQDIDINYEIVPTCVFIGCIVTDEKSNGISRKCVPTERMGKMDRLVTGAGRIEMIRNTQEGAVEEYQVQGTQVIDGDGAWCYQIPMNLDLMMTDEYGNLVPTDDSTKGIATRTRVRFRISRDDFDSDIGNSHLVKVLVPNNPKKYEDLDYNFGSYSIDKEDGSGSFRDLFWNNIYTVKSYIPRIQQGNKNRNKQFSGFKGVNINGGNLNMPYNTIRINITFMFVLQCIIFKFVVRIMKVLNHIFTSSTVFSFIFRALFRQYTCLTIGEGICPDLDGWYFAPGCSKGKGNGWKNAFKFIKGENAEISPTIDVNATDSTNAVEETNLCMTNKTDYLMQCVEINLAMEYEIINFDFTNDWMNGTVYIPRWLCKLKPKKKHTFGRAKRKERLLACTEDRYSQRRLTQQCSLEYKSTADKNGNYTDVSSKRGCMGNSKQKCHKKDGRKYEKIFGSVKNLTNGGGTLHTQETIYGQKAYYFKPCEWHGDKRVNLFLTDIVLLGSLNDCDVNGIPQAFKFLTSTSYFMPQNLVQTNMPGIAWLYSYNGGSYTCTGKQAVYDKSVSLNGGESGNTTFSNFIKWSKNKDYYEKDPFDSIEYSVTESPGIDWGISGPNQGGSNNDEIYYPGGHFLGISCINAQTNIKSCINLQRMCENGSGPNSRDYIIAKDENSFKYYYTIPTGLINRSDIERNNFRSDFSTLNFNGLKTKLDTETGYRTYDFISCQTTTFNGELSNREEILKSTNWNNGVGFDDNIDTKGEKGNTAFRRTIENKDNDYYHFRFGLPYDATDDDKKNKFLINNSNTLSFPMYENSYYFYFGLNEGKTAYDKLFDDYFANCSTLEEDESFFSVTVKDAEFCNVYAGNVTINFSNVESPYYLKISSNDMNIVVKEGENILTPYSSYSFVATESEIVFSNKGIYLKGDEKSPIEYELYLESNDGENKILNFSVSVNYDKEYTITTNDVDEMSETGVTASFGVKTDADIIGYIVTNDEKTQAICTTASTITCLFDEDSDNGKISAITYNGVSINLNEYEFKDIDKNVTEVNVSAIKDFSGVTPLEVNETLSLYSIVSCDDNKYKMHYVNDFYVKKYIPVHMCIGIDSFIIKNNDNDENGVISAEDLLTYINNGSNGCNNSANTLSERNQIALLENIFYSKSAFDGETHTCNVYATNGNAPYTSIIAGSPEYFYNSVGSEEEDSETYYAFDLGVLYKKETDTSPDITFSTIGYSYGKLAIDSAYYYNTLISTDTNESACTLECYFPTSGFYIYREGNSRIYEQINGMGFAINNTSLLNLAEKRPLRKMPYIFINFKDSHDEGDFAIGERTDDKEITLKLENGVNYDVISYGTSSNGFLQLPIMYRPFRYVVAMYCDATSGEESLTNITNFSSCTMNYGYKIMNPIVDTNGKMDTKSNITINYNVSGSSVSSGSSVYSGFTFDGIKKSGYTRSSIWLDSYNLDLLERNNTTIPESQCITGQGSLKKKVDLRKNIILRVNLINYHTENDDNYIELDDTYEFNLYKKIGNLRIVAYTSPISDKNEKKEIWNNITGGTYVNKFFYNGVLAYGGNNNKYCDGYLIDHDSDNTNSGNVSDNIDITSQVSFSIDSAGTVSLNWVNSSGITNDNINTFIGQDWANGYTYIYAVSDMFTVNYAYDGITQVNDNTEGDYNYVTPYASVAPDDSFYRFFIYLGKIGKPLYFPI